MATSELCKDRSSKLLDALTLHKPVIIKRKRGYTTFTDSTSHLMEDAGDQRLNIGQDNQSTVDSVESVIDEVHQLCILLIYFYNF